MRTTTSATACAFDTPTLRGIADTAPYLHDGSAATLAKAIAHAGGGGDDGSSSSGSSSSGGDDDGSGSSGSSGSGQGLSADDSAALVAYLRSL